MLSLFPSPTKSLRGNARWQRHGCALFGLARFLLHSSYVERMAADLLAFHSFTLSYTSTYSLIHLLCSVYRRQVSTIGEATLHMVSMSHQRYVAWAAMCMFCMRGHEQWLRASLTSVEDLYNVSFRGAARDTHAMWHNVLLSRTRALWEEAASFRRAVFQSAAMRAQLIIWTSGGPTGPPSQNTGRRWPGVKE